MGIVEIGAPDVLSYGDMMRTYARLRGLRRLMIPVPVPGFYPGPGPGSRVQKHPGIPGTGTGPGIPVSSLVLSIC